MDARDAGDTLEDDGRSIALTGVAPTQRSRRAPPLPLLLVEGQRALLEGLTLRPSAGLLRRASKGDGHPVLVLPGFTAGDGSTRALRRYLSQLGYGAHPWLQGRNLGLRGDLAERLSERVVELNERYGRRLSLVGWSLGGIYARELAKRLPDRIRHVVTLGSPFADAGRASNASRLYALFAGRPPDHDQSEFLDSLRQPPGSPSTSIYTRSDGVVHWRACLEPDTDHTENIEVPGSHCGLGVNPLVLYLVADRLAQPEGAWRPFDRTGWRRIVYR